VLWYVSGNRDEAEFADPDVFDIGRAPNRHLSFGRGGPHLCLGVHLARLEVRVVLAALARRVARFELAGPPRRIRSNFTNVLRALPVRVRLARPAPGARPAPFATSASAPDPGPVPRPGGGT
jgi:cytochrome P450